MPATRVTVQRIVNVVRHRQSDKAIFWLNLILIFQISRNGMYKTARHVESTFLVSCGILGTLTEKVTNDIQYHLTDRKRENSFPAFANRTLH